MSIKLASFLPGLFATANTVAAATVAGKLSGYGTIAQQAIKSAVTTVDGGIDHLRSAYDTYKSANPVVSTAVGEFATLAETVGLQVPSLDQIETHLKAAIYDLAGAVVPASVLGSPPSTTTTTADPVA
ncbi:hypothetical protein JUN65_01975 [Gluconacetobacter azotocaptans]|uniref:hypothetical protein n=1 Tax=Gluconacetobacter azotocaptans TaxID=142834 RepID=UPI00195B7B53|nr:hypothetical protein [Gluconacetobacter azotocaptans]MBM9400361.1 hypothetical protein [Gluconacetobacter azotocaptans]